MIKALKDSQIEQFIQEGYIRLDNAFSKELAEEGRNILWRDTNCDPKNPNTWTQPVIRLGDYAQPPFREAANTPLLHSAFNQLVGEGRWFPRVSLGTFPVRFPALQEPGDAGWHVDASFPGDNSEDIFSWRLNIRSKGRCLLMLFLFSDVGDADAPTRIRVGSHLDIAKVLEPAGEEGLSFVELAGKLEVTSGRRQIFATGMAGTVYLCHPFLVHAAQPHRGMNPRFMAQPPLYAAKEFQIYRKMANYSPVEIAIRKGIGLVN